MSQQVEIICAEGQEAYQVILTGKDRSVFENAKKSPDVIGKQGEELVAAIVALGGILRVERFKDDMRNDGPKGEPALLTFNDNGTVRALRHFQQGILGDGASGEIATLQFDHTGAALVYAAHFDNGIRMNKLTPLEMAIWSELNKVSKNTFVPKRTRTQTFQN